MPCNFCGSDRFRILCASYVAVDGLSYRFLACRDCGLLAVDPLPHFDPHEQGRANQETFHTEKRRELFAPYLRSLEAQLDLIERHVRPPGRLFDFGCGTGHFLRAAARRGWEGEGVDVVPEPLATERPCGFVIHSGRVDEYDPPAGGYDAVNLAHVLEHLPDPRGALEKASRILRPGGVLAIGVPNPRALIHAARNLVHRLRGRLGRTRYSADLFPPFHLYAFPARTLVAFLSRIGLAVLAVRSVPFGDARLAGVFRQSVLRGPGREFSVRRGIELAIDAAAQSVARCSLTYVHARKAGTR